MSTARQLALFDNAPAGPPLETCARALAPGARTRYCVLGSGSSGNCVVIESDGRRLLVDAGFSCREIELRLREAGVEPRSIEALVLTHEHGDHSRGAHRFAHRYRVPVHASPGTLRAALVRRVRGTVPLRPGSRVELAGVSVETFAVPHDAREPVGVLIEDADGRRLGLVADLGAPSAAAWARLRALSAVLLETNHDLEMLRSGPYPWRLKKRVAGGLGHLSNLAAADGLLPLLEGGLHTVVLYHLSRINNLPALAHEAVAEKLARCGSTARIELTDQFRPTPWLPL